jgi:hypothetical protein
MSLEKFKLSYRELREFYDYMNDFYGPEGLYTGDYFGEAMSLEEFIGSLIDYLGVIEERGVEFCGDSIDREGVRDIILEKRELVKA